MSLYMIKGLIQQYDIKLYIPNIGALKYIKQLLAVLKEKIYIKAIIVGNFIPHFEQRTDHQIENQ